MYVVTIVGDVSDIESGNLKHVICDSFESALEFSIHAFDDKKEVKS